MMGQFSGVYVAATKTRERLEKEEPGMEVVRPNEMPLTLPRDFAAVDKRVETPKRVLVCDRDEAVHMSIAEVLLRAEASSFEVIGVRSSIEASQELLTIRDSGAEYDLVIWGVVSPFEEDFETSLQELREIRELIGSSKILMLAPQEALAFGASLKTAGSDFTLIKPVRSEEFVAALFKLTVETPAQRRVLKMSEPRGENGQDLGLIGESDEMLKVVAMIRKVGKSSVNVLITGESGTGKEMVAQAVHKVSDRRGKPFIAINCAAIPRELLESELFGHAKGAFTGATAARRGLFEEADGGTLLLDEIGDLPMSLQAKILRVLQTRQVKPVGQNHSKEVDVRIVSATHKNLKTLIQKGEFREDLYYRLNVMPIHLPPLRERKEDILLLADFFLKRYAETGRGPLRGLTRKASAKLQSLPWKGNVRELENVIERAIVLAEGDLITDEEVMYEETEPIAVSAEDLFNTGLSLRDIEREYIKYVLARTGNKKEAATRILGIDRKTLYRKEKLYGIHLR